MGVFYYINICMSKSHAVIVYGRFQPPTLAHHMVAQKAIQRAKDVDGDHIIFGSHSEGSEDNPLSNDKKLEAMKLVLGTNNVVIDKNLKGLAHVLQHVHSKGYKKITLIAGDDRVEGFEKFKQYFGKKTKDPRTGNILDLSNIKPENFNVESAGARDPDSEADASDMKSISGTKMRAAADSGDIESFRNMLPSHVNEKQATTLMHDVKTGLESARMTKPKKRKLKETASAQTRMKLARAARRTAKRRAIVRKMRSKRRKNTTQLRSRAKNEIKDQLRRRVYKGNWKKLSYNQRANIDRAINKRKPMVDNMIKRIMPKVIKGESERIRNLNSSYAPELTSDILIEKIVRNKANRQPLDSEGKAKRRNQNKVNKRNQRNKESNARQAGNLKNSIMVVRTKNGDVEIIDKESYNSNIHQVLVSPEKASVANVSQYIKNKAFTNTVTSERIFGYIEGAGDGKSDKKGKVKKEESKKKESKKSSRKTTEEPQAPSIVAVKKSSKKDFFPTTHKAVDMEAGIAYVMNTALGLKPEQMVKMGLIDQATLNAVTNNPHQSFMASCQRAADQLFKQFPGGYIKHTGRLKKDTKLSKEAVENGVRDNTPKSDLLVVDGKGNVIAGLSQKIGESQLTSGGPSEITTNLKWGMMYLGDKMDPSTKKEIEKFIKVFKDDLAGNPRTKRGPTDLYKRGGEKEGEDPEVARREKLHEKTSDMLNEILNNDKNFATAFVYALMTGAGKFQEKDPAIATHLMSANKDGTNLKITPISMEMCEKMLDKVKFKMRFKSSAVETTDIKKKWNEFKDRKKKLGQKVKLTEDFRPYAYRSVIRALLSENVNYLDSSRLVNVLLESKQIDSELKSVIPPEPQSPREAIQYLDDAFDYIGDDYFKLYQFLEDSIDPNVTEPVMDWDEYSENYSTITNTIYVNGNKFEIPVETPINYSDGNVEYSLSEEYLDEKKRNYRQEYDRYHSRPEQRKNRSKRVLARRLMMKLGKVRKGDGKDVDHKDGNPRNNGKHNLRVRDKSENRADND